MDRGKDVTEAELSVMQLLWETDSATIRQLTDSLYPQGKVSQYATVQKLLDRLMDKRFVRRVGKGTPHQFAAVVGRQELLGRRLKAVADTLCGGSLTPLLTHLIQSRPLTTKELAALREMIERAGKA